MNELIQSRARTLRNSIAEPYWQARKRLSSWCLTCDVVLLRILNRVLTRSVAGDADVVVSLTTWGGRVEQVYLAIESIARGKVRPRRLILWLDEPEQFHNLPVSLRRLRGRGLEIALTENFGPHTKYYPHVESGRDAGSPLVTADDDVIYPRDWLHQLLCANRRDSEKIHCFRARTIVLRDGAFAPYLEWPMCDDFSGSPLTFLTGVSGVIYPPRALAALRLLGRNFLDPCPKNDDIWLNVVALRNGIMIKQLSSVSREFPVIPNTQGQALFHSNRFAGGNDEQLASTYRAEDIVLLEADTKNA